MIAKLIAHGESRADAIDALQAGLDDTLIAGPKTNLAFLRALLGSPTFQLGEMTTHFVDAHLAELGASPRGLDVAAALAGAAALRAKATRAKAEGSRDPWDLLDAFEIMGPRRVGFDALVEGVAERFVEIGGRLAFADGRSAPPSDALTLIADGDAVLVLNEGRQTRVAPILYPDALEAKSASASAEIRAPMHGRVAALDVGEGAEVQQGQRLGALEAMKMEHALTAPWAGRVASLAVAVGDVVEQGATLMLVEGAPK
jgi:3-methylcrotonyl-CoA carboxylase alpha subunit